MIYSTHAKPVGRIWGSLEGPEGPVGELWWVYHDDGGSARLTSVRGEETSIDRLVGEGRLPHINGRYPLLVKTLHTADRLSVQVHPGKDGGDLCKEETWIVLSAEPGSWLLAGVAPGVSPEAFEKALKEGGAEDMLSMSTVVGAQAVHIAPGTVHALGGGLEILEIQRNCDITYRLYDWGRVGTDGRPRELHLLEGLRAIDYAAAARPVDIRPGSSLDSGGLYEIDRFEGRSNVRMPPGSVLFVERGKPAGFNGTKPGTTERDWRCLLADGEGGSVELSGVATMASLL